MEPADHDKQDAELRVNISRCPCEHEACRTEGAPQGPSRTSAGWARPTDDGEVKVFDRPEKLITPQTRNLLQDADLRKYASMLLPDVAN